MFAGTPAVADAVNVTGEPVNVPVVAVSVLLFAPADAPSVQLLTGSPGQLFLSTADRSGGLTAVARVSVHTGWAGLQALWVEPEQRGRGLGRTVVHAAGLLARQRRMPSMYLQVEAENEAAIGLYESEGFRPHHTYAYLRRD